MVKWIDSDGNVTKIPVATISTILLGVGTTVTHAAIKSCANANCTLCWVGEDSLLFYAVGQSPTATSRNFRKQMELAAHKEKSLIVAKKMFMYRFPDSDLKDKSLKEIMGMEGYRVRNCYYSLSQKYNTSWKGRDCSPENFELSDVTNLILNHANNALYALLSSCIHSLGYSPYIGFIHSGSPLPFIYDIADLYKEYLTIDLAFSLTREMSAKYDKYLLVNEFRKRVVETKLLEKVPNDIEQIFKV